jgi:hypothetical protein
MLTSFVAFVEKVGKEKDAEDEFMLGILTIVCKRVEVVAIW